MVFSYGMLIEAATEKMQVEIGKLRQRFAEKMRQGQDLRQPRMANRFRELT